MTGLSICQMQADADCVQAVFDGSCPKEGGLDCGKCLHHQRFERDDVTWLPAGKDISDFPEANGWRLS